MNKERFSTRCVSFDLCLQIFCSWHFPLTGPREFDSIKQGCVAFDRVVITGVVVTSPQLISPMKCSLLTMIFKPCAVPSLLLISHSENNAMALMKSFLGGFLMLFWHLTHTSGCCFSTSRQTSIKKKI